MLHCVLLLLIISFTDAKSLLTIDTDNIIDLSYYFKQNETVYWLGNPGFVIKSLPNNYTIYVKGNWFSGSEHGGTHIDAPSHTAEKGIPLHLIPPKQFISQGIRVDIREQASKDINYALTVKDLEKWEEDNGRIPEGAIMLLYTGWGKNYGKPFYIKNSENQLNFPGISGEAARWLVHKRNIFGVGIDAASIDPGNSKTYPAHITVSKANKFILENVANMDKLPGARGFVVIALPMKIYDGTGGPTRVFALPSGSPSLTVTPMFIILLMSLLYM